MKNKTLLYNAIKNTMSGFIISLILQYLCLNFLTIKNTMIKSVIITVIFTIVSIIRCYIFNVLLTKKLYKE